MGIIFDKPLIGVVMCQVVKNGHPTQMVHNKYLDAVLLAGGIPLALPHNLMSAPDLLENAMAALDGILLTGSPSNIEPHHYQQPGEEPDADPGRDRLAFALIHHALERQMPLLAICRGLQELVVATGGSLHPQLPLVAGMQRHHEDPRLTLDEQYAPVHEVWLEPDGLLAPLVHHASRLRVNSLHRQGVRSLGSALRAEARSADGLIEAVSHTQHPFALAVQWHPEWRCADSPPSLQLFHGLVGASRYYHKEKR